MAGTGLLCSTPGRIGLGCVSAAIVTVAAGVAARQARGERGGVKNDRRNAAERNCDRTAVLSRLQEAISDISLRSDAHDCMTL